MSHTLFALVVLCASAVAPGRTVQAGPPLDYRALVESYRVSGAAEVEQLVAIPRERVTDAVDTALSDRSGWRWDDLRGAAMLHSDAAIHRVRDRDMRGADFHVLTAQRLLERVVALSRPQEDFAWRWHIAVPPLLEELGGAGIAKRIRAHATARWSTSGARAKYVRGVQFESRGNAGGRVLRPGESALMIAPQELQSHWFVLAADAFAGALKEDPQLGAAALHLGRIRMVQGERSEAAALLRDALVDVDPAVVYLAALFLGSLEERDGRVDAAEQLYRRALTAFPYGQAAPLALAQLLSRTGRDAEAHTTLRLRLTSAPRAIEPSWAHAAGLSLESGTRFGLLRAETWK